jgi:putative flippase GtrA
VQWGWPWSWLRRREFAFLLVGAINTAVGLAAFAALFSLWGDTLHYMGALVLAYAIGILVAFVLHRRFVFHVQGNVVVDFLRFTAVQGLSFAINAVALPILVEIAGLPVLPAQVLAMGLVVVSSYFGHLLFSFRRPA